MARTENLPSNEYWEHRANLRMTEIERGASSYLDNINGLYSRASNEIREDIEQILQAYMRNGQLTFSEAIQLLREPLPAAEISRLREQIMLIEDLDERSRLLARLNAPAYRARIDRLEATELSAQVEMARLAPGQISETHEALMQSGQDAYMRTVFDLQKGTGLGYNFAQVTDDQIEEVIRQNWSGDQYSDRIWNNVDSLAKRVPKIIQQNMTTGRSWRHCMGEIGDLVQQGGMRSAERILRTEAAYVANEMEAQAYDDADIERYRFVATLDGRTSELCQEHDGKVYDLADRDPGENYPPLHPYCRSTTIADFGDDELAGLERRARDPETGESVTVPADTTYQQWKDGLTEDQKGALQFNQKASTNKAADQKQYDKYRPIIGKSAGKSLAQFQHMKYQDLDEWSRQRNYMSDHSAGELPEALTYPIWKNNMMGVKWKAVDFAPGKLEQHAKHLKKYQGLSLDEYRLKAINLMNAPVGGAIEGFIGKEGFVFRYNAEYNDFADAKPSGVVETMFKPSRGRAYWEDQIKKYGGE